MVMLSLFTEHTGVLCVQIFLDNRNQLILLLACNSKNLQLGCLLDKLLDFSDGKSLYFSG